MQSPEGGYSRMLRWMWKGAVVGILALLSGGGAPSDILGMLGFLAGGAIGGAVFGAILARLIPPKRI